MIKTNRIMYIQNITQLIPFCILIDFVFLGKKRKIEGEQIFWLQLRAMWGNNMIIYFHKYQPIIQSSHQHIQNLSDTMMFTILQDPTEFGTFMSALKCTKCPGYMLPDVGFCSRDENIIWSCNKCNFQTTEAKVSKLLSSIENKITKMSRYV